jgi:hypothetical protein
MIIVGMQEARVEQLPHDPRKKDRAREARWLRRLALCTESVRINKCLWSIPRLSLICTRISTDPSPSRQLSSCFHRRHNTPRPLVEARFAAASSIFHSHLPRGHITPFPSPHISPSRRSCECSHRAVYTRCHVAFRDCCSEADT